MKAQLLFFGPDADSGDQEGRQRRTDEVEEALDIFSDVYMNKHLIYGAVEVLLVRLLPELAERGVGELMGERLL